MAIKPLGAIGFCNSATLFACFEKDIGNEICSSLIISIYRY